MEGSLLEYGGLQPILPFLGGRSDAACRVVIRLHAVPQRFLQRRGAPHRFPPSRLPPMGTYGLNRDAARHVATNAPPHPALPPTCAVPTPYLGRCTLGFHAKIRGCSGPGRALVRRRYGGIRGNGWGHTGLHGLRIWWGRALVATWRAASRLRMPHCD